MKKFYYILLLITVGCYSDDSEIITSENVAHNTSELTLLLKSISSHNAAFDDRIDNTNCFSIIFPYQIQVNSELRTINSIEDISLVSSDDDIEIVYPISSVFYNYEEHQAINQTEFNLIKNTCNVDFNIEANHCLDIQFPITVKEFNDLTESFDSYQFNNDKEAYLHLDNLHDNDVYEINYPIFLRDFNSDLIRVDSSQEFIETINASFQSCD